VSHHIIAHHLLLEAVFFKGEGIAEGVDETSSFQSEFCYFEGVSSLDLKVVLKAPYT
jgi:hypothetical protein